VKGNSGFSISINGIEKVSVLSRSPLSFTVVDLILSGFCTSSSIPAFGNMKASCFVKNLPPATSPGQIEFSYVWANNTALVTSKNLESIDLGTSLFLIEMNLPNVASKVLDVSQLKLQIVNKNFPSLIFSFNIEILPSPPVIIFIDPVSGPNNEATKVTVYVEYFQGSTSALEAKVNGVPMTLDSYRAESIDISTTALYFALPRALKAGRHSVSFWSGDNDPLTFLFTALDALTPRLKYMFPSQGSTKGGDAIFIMIDNFDVQGDLEVFFGVARAQVEFLECFQRSCTISAVLPITSNAAVMNVTLSSSSTQFVLPQQFQSIAPAPRLDKCFPAIGLISGGTSVTCYFLDVPDSSSLSRVNVTARFDASFGAVSSVVTLDSSFAVSLVSPATLFEGNVSINVRFGPLSFSHMFQYVRPCNFEVHCPSIGFIPNDQRLSRQPP